MAGRHLTSHNIVSSRSRSSRVTYTAQVMVQRVVATGTAAGRLLKVTPTLGRRRGAATPAIAAGMKQQRPAGQAAAAAGSTDTPEAAAGARAVVVTAATADHTAVMALIAAGSTAVLRVPAAGSAAGAAAGAGASAATAGRLTGCTAGTSKQALADFMVIAAAAGTILHAGAEAGVGRAGASMGTLEAAGPLNRTLRQQVTAAVGVDILVGLISAATPMRGDAAAAGIGAGTQAAAMTIGQAGTETGTA